MQEIYKCFTILKYSPIVPRKSAAVSYNQFTAIPSLYNRAQVMSLRWIKAACFHQVDLPSIYTPDLIQFCTNTSCVILLKAFSKVRRQTVISADLTSVSSPLFYNVSQFQSDWIWSSSAVLVEKHNQGIISVSFSQFLYNIQVMLVRRKYMNKDTQMFVQTTAAGVPENMSPWWGHKPKYLIFKEGVCNWLITSFTTPHISLINNLE